MTVLENVKIRAPIEHEHEVRVCPSIELEERVTPTALRKPLSGTGWKLHCLILKMHFQEYGELCHSLADLGAEVSRSPLR